MKRFLLALVVLLFVAVAALAARVLLGGLEDEWICSNGEWIAHGNPRGPKPLSGCVHNSDEISSPTLNDNFLKTGYLIKDSPGLTPKTWYLNYEEPGKPGMIVELGIPTNLASSLAVGERVQITGRESENVVKVSSIKIIEADSKENRIVKLYYFNSQNEIEAEGQACSEKYSVYLLPVTRTIPLSKTPIKDTIDLLIKGELTAAEKQGGLSTEFPNQKFYLKSANLKNGVLTLDFPLVHGFTDGGSCRMVILSGQIIKTAKQFEEVKEVRFLNPELFQP